MKYAAMIFLVVFTLQANAQNWPMPGTIWTYCALSENEIDNQLFAGPFTVRYTHDTLISGVDFQVSKYENSSTNFYITRFSNDTVYRWVNNQEYLFFHFQMHLNEVITTYRSVGTSDTACTSILPLKVIDSATVMLGGAEVTRWRLKDTLGFDPYNTGTILYQEHWVYEYFGPASYPWLGEYYEVPGCELLSDWGYSYLDGYIDDIYPEWVAHCPTASISENNFEEIIVHPNPATEFISVSDNFDSYKIYSSDGRLVQQGKSNTDRVISVNELQNGFYILVFNREEDYITVELVIQR